MAPLLRRVRAALRGPARLPVGLAATAVCLGVAFLHAAVMPQRVPTGLDDWHASLMRWGHPTVWVVLAVVCVAFALRAAPVVLNRTAMVAVAVYLAFLLSLTFA